MKSRDIYLNKLITFKDKPLIKVITGIRRCGKSTLLDLFEEYLLNNGIEKENIIHMNFEDLTYDEIKDYKDLNKYIKEKILDNDKKYIILDEIQQVSNWEKAINSFLVTLNCDIYITGSNAYLLSSEISTLLSGRYVEIKMLPLSFKEYLDFNDYNTKENLEEHFNDYLLYGGLPIVSYVHDKSAIRNILSGVFNTVIIKDVAKRNSIRDITLLENLIRYIAQNIGSPISSRNISNYLNSAGRKTSTETIDNYLKMLENAFIIYKANRFDIKGKMYLKTLEKYYVVDTGIRNELLSFKDGDYGHMLENLVYLELLRRGYDVSVGKIDNLEVDFIAQNYDEKIYYQVSASILDENTKKRELNPFDHIPDHYEKVILTMDRSPIKDFNGIKNINIIDFLLQ
ncbi:MAG: ATP-binding protein [Clostridium sp.]|nr:ATP-binding protein [Clostridium sp.]